MLSAPTIGARRALAIVGLVAAVFASGGALAACGGGSAGESSAGSGSSDPARRACPAGDALVQVDAEAAALSGCAAVNGDLVVGPSFTLDSAAGLADIARVTGTVDVSDNIELGGVFLPGLVSVGGDVVIENNRQLETASLHHLVEVGGDLTVRDNLSLLRLDLGALRRVGGAIRITGHPVLEAVALDALTRAGRIVVEDDAAWPAEEVDALERRVHPRAAPRRDR
ncbi:MAG TPA: hypothetical protein VK698_15280 [Kofleriaceae bacterium]|nr:hypothetical protein [Kofleriaceae bacterium]